MPKRYKEYVYREAQAGFLNGCNDEAISKDLHVPVRTLARWRASFKRYGSLLPPPLGPTGSPRKFTDEHVDALIEYLCQRPTAYLEEMAWFLYDNFGLIVTLSCISKRLKAVRVTLQNAQKVAAQQLVEARDQWIIKREQYSAKQLVIVDESAACERNADKKYGWSPAGLPLRESQYLDRSNRWSVLPAYTIDGYMDCTKIHLGGITKELFNAWIYEEVLPHCTPYPGPRSVLVMDNSGIHVSPEIEQMCVAANVRLEYLPPCSPDFNPIETSFHDIKAWLRKYNKLLVKEDFVGFLQAAINAHKSRNAKQHFRKAGYRLVSAIHSSTSGSGELNSSSGTGWPTTDEDFSSSILPKARTTCLEQGEFQAS